MRKELIKKTTAVALAAIMTFGAGAMNTAVTYADMCGGLEMEDVYTPDESDVIQDPILHWAVRSALNSIKERDMILTPELVGSKKIDTIIYENGSHPEDFEKWGNRQHLVKSLEGLQYAKYVNHIDISYSDGVAGNEIEDLTPISGLTQLVKLKLYKDGITDISALSGLVNLREMSVRSNKITDVTAVKDMTKLTNLDFGYNQVSNVSAVVGLTNLKYLDMCNNNISELPDLTSLKSLETLNVSNNKLTNKDVEMLAGMTNLQQLDLLGNTDITDVKPLVELTNLEKEKTLLPVDAATKDDLFASIAVNSDFMTFNISKMTSDDLDYVQIALDNYDKLTASQKEYLDPDMVAATRKNAELVKAGKEPEYIEKYDRGGIAKPVLNRIDVSVVDNNGHPLQGIKVVKMGIGSLEATTDAAGKVSFQHQSWDSDKDLRIMVSANEYVCKPNQVSYEVKSGKTYIVNGKRATGFEKIQFVLTPSAEYVDKDALEEAIKQCGTIDDEDMFTDKSLAAYQDALAKAKDAFDSKSATQENVDEATANLRKAYDGLEAKKVLTTLKINIKDENGNFFVRAFKLQIVPNNNVAAAWNIWSDKDNDISNGVARLSTSPNWKAGTNYEILACNHEAYDFDKKIVATIDKSDDGTVYFSKVNGQPVDASFKIDVTAIPRADGAQDKENEINPDSSRLKAYIAKANKYEKADYTPATYENLTKAVEAASQIMADKRVAQEVYNQAGADVISAIKGLEPVADTIALEKAINLYYGKDNYTTASWTNYETAKANAVKVLEDANSTQAQVDEATKSLKDAQSALVLRGNKEDLEKKIANAEKVTEAEVQSGYDALQDAITKAKAVVADEDATIDDVDAAEKAIDDALNNLVMVPEEKPWDCMPSMFRAKVIDSKGNPVSGVPFKVMMDGKEVVYDNALSDDSGIISFYFDGLEPDKEIVVTAEGSDDSHSFELRKVTFGFFSYLTMGTLDGKPFSNGTYLTYSVVSDEPEPFDAEDVVFAEKDQVRYYGPSRYDTALEVADALKKAKNVEKFENIVVACGGDYPDALAGGYLANKKNAPIILVNDATEGRILDYIKSNIAEDGTVYILGGTGAVSSKFEDSVKTAGLKSERLGGKSRYETNLMILENAGVDADEMMVCSGTGFADSLSASATNRPILLVGKELTPEQKAFLDKRNTEHFYIIGGEGAVNGRIESSLKKSYGDSKVSRVFGSSRYETSAEVAKKFFKESGKPVVLAYAQNFPDGLSGSTLAMELGAPLLLTDGTEKGVQAAQSFTKNMGVKRSITLGGPSLISDSVVTSIVNVI